MRKVLLFIVFLLFLGYISVKGQTDTHFSQYMFNEVTFNPASIEITNTLNASLVARQQWVGFEDAPSTQIFNASTYLQDIYGGIGLNIINDYVGYENFLIARAFYAYPIQTGVLSTITLGLGAGVMSRTIDGSQLIYIDPTDPLAYYDKVTFVNPDFNFGVEYVDPNLTAGFAITHLNYKSYEKATSEYPPMHYYLYGKYRFEDVFDRVDIQPYLLFKSNLIITQFDINVIGYYDDMVWTGFSYRLGDAISAMVGYQITHYLAAGYAYDYAVGTSRGYSGGSHEIMLQLTLEGFNRTRITPQTPRIFN